MTILAIIVFVFAGVQITVALVNFVFIQPFALEKVDENDFLSILIPARNEEENIGRLLTCLVDQKKHPVEILVFNDQSTDKTEEIVQHFATEHGHVRLINSEGLPEGWLGKNHACHRLAQQAKGNYLLFLDADIVVEGNFIWKAVQFVKKNNLGLLSIFPKQWMETTGEKVTVPIMNFILLTLLPLVLVRKTAYPSLSAANGQFMLFDAAIYHRFLPHFKFKAEKVEDIEISRFLKKANMNVACVSGKPEIKCKMYNGFSEAVRGFSKNIFHFFGNSVAVTLLFWIITTFGFIPLCFLGIHYVLLYLFIILTTRILVSIVSNQSIVQNLILLIPQQIVFGIIIFEALISIKKKKLTWKGRNIS